MARPAAERTQREARPISSRLPARPSAGEAGEAGQSLKRDSGQHVAGGAAVKVGSLPRESARKPARRETGETRSASESAIAESTVMLCSAILRRKIDVFMYSLAGRSASALHSAQEETNPMRSDEGKKLRNGNLPSTPGRERSAPSRELTTPEE